MSSSTVIPRTDPGKLALIQHINATLPAYAAVLDLSPADLTQLDRATAWFKYGLDLQSALKAAAEAGVAFKNSIRDGTQSGSAAIPSVPILTPPAGDPVLDVFGYLANLITRIKIHKNYTEALGKALNIIPTQGPGLDLTSVQPILDVEFQTGHPRILWTMHGLDALEIEADHGEGQFTLFTIDTTPNHTDMTHLPPIGGVALWKYRAIYRVRDERVGNWSQVLEVSVKGI